MRMVRDLKDDGALVTGQPASQPAAGKRHCDINGAGYVG
jgi:hypothetical protein